MVKLVLTAFGKFHGVANNPTKDILNIDSRVALDVEVYDMMGKLVISEKEARQIDLTGIIPGVYNISIIYDKYRFNKRVVKQ